MVGEGNRREAASDFHFIRSWLLHSSSETEAEEEENNVNEVRGNKRSQCVFTSSSGDRHAYKYFLLSIFSSFSCLSVSVHQVRKSRRKWGQMKREKMKGGKKMTGDHAPSHSIRMSSSIHQYMWSFGWLELISTECLNATFNSFTFSLLAPSQFK